MNNLSVSVIIPNYNKSKYIEKCINSILSQTLIPKEIIVVDDCSTDNSVLLLKQLEEKNNIIKLVELKENVGVSKARNIGASYAKSEYIKFIDADDFFYGNDNIEKEMKCIEKYRDKKKDVLSYSALVFSDEEGNITSFLNPRKKGRFVNGKATSDILARTRFVSIANNFTVSKKVFESCGGFNYPINLYEDYEILIRLSYYVKFYFSGTLGRVYRWTPDGLSKQKKSIHDEVLKNIFDMYYSKLSFFEKMQVNCKVLMRKIKKFIKGEKKNG